MTLERESCRVHDHPSKREVVGLGSAGREHDVAWLGGDQPGHFRPRVVQRGLRALPVRVDARRVSEEVTERADHRLLASGARGVVALWSR